MIYYIQNNILFFLFFISYISASQPIIYLEQLENKNESTNVALIELSVDSQLDIYGIQFDVNLNNNEISIIENGIISTVPDINIYSKIYNNGKARVLMFSLNGNKIIDTLINNYLNVIQINFQPVNMFRGESSIEFTNIILAGKGGEELIVLNKSASIDFSLPDNTNLLGNYPNPFTLSTNIKYQISEPGFVSLKIYDIDGFLVKTLVNDYQISNYYNLEWYGDDDNYKKLSPGRYMLKMIINKYSKSLTIILVN